MDFSFVHAADLHLDSPLRAAPAQGALRSLFQGATLTALSRIVDLCLSERVDFLVIAGDLFEFSDRSVRARLALCRELGRLDEAGIRSFIVHGNHDPLSTDNGLLRLPPSVKVFGPQWEEVQVQRDGTTLCRVQGISYRQERVSENLSRFFSRTGPEFAIGVLHANLGGSSGHANYAPCTLEDLSARGLDYWALGHVHTRAEHVLPSGGVAVYPGNPQGRHPGETGERGCVLVKVSEQRPVRRFCAIAPIRWSKIWVDISTVPTWDALLSAIAESAEASCGEGPDAHAVTWVLSGQGPLHRELMAADATSDLVEELRRRFAARTPPLVIESIRDETRPLLDLDPIVAAGGLGSAIVATAQSAHNHGAFLSTAWSGADLSRMESALRSAGISSPREDGRRLITRAMFRALELLQDQVSL